MSYLFEKYIDKIKELPKSKINKSDILNFKFFLSEDKNMKVYYAPHNEYINKEAKVVIVGICPGWTQTELAYKRAKKDLEQNINIDDILKRCKEDARFAGSMRKNLIEMLDELGLPNKLNISSISELFENNNNIMHTTSLIPYPVFVNDKNYTGHSPEIIKSKFLMEYVRNHFFREIQLMKEKPFIIPLGRAVEDVLRIMIDENILKEEQCLFSFPHPSGANGHRIEYFEKNRDLLIKTINLYFDKK